MDFKQRKYHLRPVHSTEAEPIAKFYNTVIGYNRNTDGRDITWTDFTPQYARELALEGELLIVLPKKATMARYAIHAAVIMNHDNFAWSDKNFTSENSIHFEKAAVTAEGGLRGFGRQVLWPLMKKRAVLKGFDTLYTEVDNFGISDSSADQLRSYHESLGMDYQGESDEYGDGFGVSRFSYTLKK